MQKHHALLTAALVTVSAGLGLAVTTVTPATPVQAKAKAAKVLATSGIKKAAYNINGGYLYRNAKLTKKVTSSKHLLRTTLYTYKRANVKKANGKHAVYYYVKNHSGSVKGWAWRGNLSKKRSYAQQTKDIKGVLAIIRTMSSYQRNLLLSNFMDITPKNAYSEMGQDLSYIAGEIENRDDINAAGKLYQYFQGRFSNLTNAKLTAVYNSYKDAIDEDADGTAVGEATENLYDALADAISSL